MGERLTIQLLAGVRQSGESRKALIACNDWLRLGPGRSLPALLARYTGVAQPPPSPADPPTETDPIQPPTTSLATLKEWSAAYGWETRAEAYDSLLEEIKNARRALIMSEGLALDYERVDTLKAVVKLLITQLYEQNAEGVLHNLWVPDVKQIGVGPFAERVDIEVFNAPLLRELRGALDDLAKETGGRVHKAEVTGKDGVPLFKLYAGLDVDRV